MNNLLLDNCRTVASSLEDAIARSEQVLHDVGRALQSVAWDARLVQYMPPPVASFPLSSTLPGATIPTTAAALATTAFIPRTASFPLMWPSPPASTLHAASMMQPPTLPPLQTRSSVDTPSHAPRSTKRRRDPGSPQPRAVRTHSHLRPADAVHSAEPAAEQATLVTSDQGPPEGWSDGPAEHAGRHGEDAAPVPQEATIRSHRSSGDASSPASASSSHSTGSVKIRHRHRQEDDVQGPAVPGPQEAVVITDSGALDDGETLSSERARQAVANGPAGATNEFVQQERVEDLDATTLEARALLLAQRLGLR